jgi:hypothetical protein
MQVASLSERAGTRLPVGTVVPGAAPLVEVGVAPRDPADTVLVLVRRHRGPAQILRAMAERIAASGEDVFRAVLPTVESGERLEYRVELLRAGERVATLPVDGTWLSVTGGPGAGIVDPPACGPRFDYELSFLGSLSLEFRPEVIGLTPEGFRINFYVERGRLTGPAIDATARPGGGDWFCLRFDGVGALDVRITYETGNGALLFYRAGGVLDLAPAVYSKLVAGDLQCSAAVYATPTFVTADPRWLWLNRVQGVAVGRVEFSPPTVDCDVYLPRLLGRRGDG